MPEIASHICTKIHLSYLQLILVFQDLFLSIDCRLDMSLIFMSKMVHPWGPTLKWVQKTQYLPRKSVFTQSGLPQEKL